MINAVFEVSDEVNDGRTVQGVLNAATSELGELAVEVNIKYGASYKKPGPDGIVGEAVDAIAALLDLIHLEDPELDEGDILYMLDKKLAKWKSLAQPQQ